MPKPWPPDPAAHREFEERARPAREAADAEAGPFWALQLALDDMSEEDAARAMAEWLAGEQIAK